MRQFAATLREHESSGLLTLTRSTEIPRVEMLLVADGRVGASAGTCPPSVSAGIGLSTTVSSPPARETTTV